VPESPAAALAAFLDAELAAPVPEGVAAVADAVRRRHGEAVAAILFYGSCLRRAATEGVLDFYVLVDRYRSVHRSAALAALNRLLPPSVFYLEHPARGELLRVKYAVISTRDFLRAAGPRPLDGRIWARFCQPARLVYARDLETRRAALEAVARATRTAVDRMRGWLPGGDSVQRFRPADLWRNGFRETYRAELRTENAATIGALYESHAERFDRVAELALRALEGEGQLRVLRVEAWIEIESDPTARARARFAWRLRRPLAKAIAIAGLLKTPATFDGWAPYALWKLERHTGVHIELTERQRRRPMLWGWPVLLRVLRRRMLR